MTRAWLIVATTLFTSQVFSPGVVVAEVHRRSLPELCSEQPDLRTGSQVRVQGVVTLALRGRQDFAIQEGAHGIYATTLNDGASPAAVTVRESLRPGDRVEIEGTLDAGGYRPRLLVKMLTVIGTDPLPEPQPADMATLFCGGGNALRTQIRGVVQAILDHGRFHAMIVDIDGRRMVVRCLHDDLPQPTDSLVDATVRVVGVTGAVRNTRGEFLGPSLWLSRPGDCHVIERPPADAFTALKYSLATLAAPRDAGRSFHRIRTEGVVTLSVPGEFLYLQDGLQGVRVQLVAADAYEPGEIVEVSGFVDMERQIAGIAHAVARRLGVTKPPPPVDISPEDIFRLNAAAREAGIIASPSTYDGCLIRFRARLLEVREFTAAGRVELMLLQGDRGLSAVCDRLPPQHVATLRGLKPGSELDLTGIFETVLLGDEGVRSMIADPVIEQMRILLRSATDVAVVRHPSWWSPQRLRMLLAAVAAGLTGSLAWAWLLRSQVAATTKRLAAAMQSRRDAAVEFEATLRERNRLAANLHDTLLQTLTGIDFQLGACRAAGNGSVAKAATPHLDIAQKMVAHAAEELRGSVWALRTMPVAGRSFQESLDVVARQAEHGHATRVVVRAEGRTFDLPQFIAGNLLLVAQEAIHNAVRHSNADRVDVVAAFDPVSGSIEVSVRDEGCGFTPGTQRGPDQGHFGLSGMRERIDRLGGSFAVASHPDGGTTVRATVVINDYDTRIGVETGGCAPSAWATERIDVGDHVSPARDE